MKKSVIKESSKMLKEAALEGAPKKVGGDFICHVNGKRFTEKQVRAVCNIKGKVYV